MAAPIPFAGILASLLQTLLAWKETRRVQQVKQEIGSSILILPTEISPAKLFQQGTYPWGRNPGVLVTIWYQRNIRPGVDFADGALP
jgi:hypothetical protein